MQQGSRLRADYEVIWDKDGFFRNSKRRAEQGKRWATSTDAGGYRSGASGHHSQVSRFSTDDARRKRFKVGNKKTQLNFTGCWVQILLHLIENYYDNGDYVVIISL